MPLDPASVFVSHGSPSRPLDDVPARTFLRELGTRLPRPRAIVAVSAHTAARGIVVGSAPRMHAIHGFGGFPEADVPVLGTESVTHNLREVFSSPPDAPSAIDRGVFNR
jgi:aromatic ring-opening dioxygenase catalytic subunit (LigB family)